MLKAIKRFLNKIRPQQPQPEGVHWLLKTPYADY